ncbi:MAG: hypothetical protein JSR77_08050 [Planctomycetes bacterium]|nr:hypothetical protein [Planctomycetota bacterium]
MSALLVAGGGTSIAGDRLVEGVVAWDGHAWTQLGHVNGSVTSLAVFNGRLIASGTFKEADGQPCENIAAWDGTSWTALGAGLQSGASVLYVYGSDLIAGGRFRTAGGINAERIAAWNGSSWRALGAGVNGEVKSLTTFGGELIAAGAFATAGGSSIRYIARWNGSAWRALGAGITGSFGSADSVCVYQNELYATGNFRTVGASPVPYMARWNGVEWRSAGWDIAAPARALRVYGADLIASARLPDAAQTPSLRAFDGATWRYFAGTESDQIRVTATALPGEFNGSLIAVGSVEQSDGFAAWGVALWDGSGWRGTNAGVSGSLRKLAQDPFGGVIGIGTLSSMGGPIARWNGAAWTAIAHSLTPFTPGDAADISSVAFYNGELIATGSFASIDGVEANNVARWDGERWLPLGAGLDASGGAVQVLGADLFVSGRFLNAGGIAAKRIARWDGYSWHALGSGIDGSVTFDPEGALGPGINTLAAYGQELIVGGIFSQAGDQAVSGMAAWNGATWRRFGSVPCIAYRLVNYRGTLVASLQQQTAPTFYDSGVAQWNGSQWVNLGQMNSCPLVAVLGDDLYAAGEMRIGGSLDSYTGLVRYDGAAWQTIGEPVSIGSLASQGPELLASGSVMTTDGRYATALIRRTQTGVPWFAAQPEAQVTVCRVDEVELAVTAAIGYEPIGYRWQAETSPDQWCDLSDGPVGGCSPESDAIASGSNSPVLRLAGVTSSLRVRCVVGNACGEAVGNPTQVSPCRSDFTCDGGLDGGDVEAFFRSWEAGESSADVNNDSGIDGMDVGAFFAAWEAGTC